jgi:hypothetical protein
LTRPTPWLALVALIGCGGDGEHARPPPSLPAAIAPPPPLARTSEPPPPQVEDLAATDDEAAVLSASGALSVWNGVLERHRLLERRGQSGALHGMMAADGDGGQLLVDEQKGRGTLFVRLALPDGVSLTPGERVVAWGAFVAGEDGWRWKVSRAGRLPARADGDLAAVLPSHVPRTATTAVEGAMVPSALVAAIAQGLRKRSREVTLRFTVLEPPVRVGDGWRVGDGSDEVATAILVLPGEESIYGGLDYLADDERWSLQRRTAYTVTAAVPARLRRVGLDQLPIFEALDAPVAIAP